MKLITTIMMLLDLFISVASSEPRGPSGTAPEGLFDRSPSELPYPVGTMTFMGTLGGHDVQLNGSIEEVYGQMKNLYPDFNADALVLDGKLARENGTEGELNVVTRGADNKGALYCCPNDPWDWQPASNRRIWEGISYLDNLNGLCGVGARNCVRISCSWWSAIYLCNDNFYGITPSCTYMASYAADIINDCMGTSWWNEYDQSCGQKFDTDNYNIIVRQDRC